LADDSFVGWFLFINYTYRPLAIILPPPYRTISQQVVKYRQLSVPFIRNSIVSRNFSVAACKVRNFPSLECVILTINIRCFQQAFQST